MSETSRCAACSLPSVSYVGPGSFGFGDDVCRCCNREQGPMAREDRKTEMAVDYLKEVWLWRLRSPTSRGYHSSLTLTTV